MRKIYLCLILILPTLSFAQSPCSDTQVILSSQAEVDAFPLQYCNTLCRLTIQGNDITNLDSIYVLQKVGLLVVTFNPVLTNIDGLRNLTVIENSCTSPGLTIDGNNMLSDLDGLSGLTRIEGPLAITSNTMLSDISGLSNLREVNSIGIGSNASLENINALGGLTRIDGSLDISGNPGLRDLSGLSNIALITDALSIEYSDALTTLDGLSALTRVGGPLSLTSNNELINIEGLSNLNHVGQITASGVSMSVVYNGKLTSLNGLQGLDTIPGTLSIEGNAALLDLDGLSSVRTLDNEFAGSYNGGIRIADNNSLVDISGISGIGLIGHARSCYLEIVSNASLTTIDSLSLTEINGTNGSWLRISGNANLKNINGLSSLIRITSGLGPSSIEISENPLLQNIDGLSNLSDLSSSRSGTMNIINNTALGRFCGLYTLFHSKGINCGSTACYSTSGVTISGNERDPTPEQIEEEGPCGTNITQPTSLVFSQVTSEGMRGTFSRASGFASGYVVLMQAYGQSAPENVPQDGASYHVGQVIGSSSIVVSVGTDTTFVVSGAVPATPYYFDIFSYQATGDGNDYLTVDPLQGSQTTTSQAMLVSSLSFSEVTDNSMTVMLNELEPGNYIAFMKAFGYPSPNDVPVDGREYRVGNTVGSSTIVVNIGDGSAFTVNGLMTDLTYYFDIYRFDPTTLDYEALPSQGSQMTGQDGKNLRAYPNPFEVTTTIPFVVSDGEQAVQVLIYDTMGAEVNVLTSGSFAAGRHETNWDGYDKSGRRVRAGVYIYSVKTGSGVVTGRVSLR